jgi:NADH-quinone oxidoreductase subunit B
MFKLRKGDVAHHAIGPHRIAEDEAAEQAALVAPSTLEMKGLMR